jgi:hypothetical protein
MPEVEEAQQLEIIYPVYHREPYGRRIDPPKRLKRLLQKLGTYLHFSRFRNTVM